jgi:hypothetical protein
MVMLGTHLTLSMRIPSSPRRCHSRTANTTVHPDVLVLVTVADGAVPVSSWWRAGISHGGIHLFLYDVLFDDVFSKQSVGILAGQK